MSQASGSLGQEAEMEPGDTKAIHSGTFDPPPSECVSSSSVSFYLLVLCRIEQEKHLL